MTCQRMLKRLEKELVELAGAFPGVIDVETRLGLKASEELEDLVFVPFSSSWVVLHAVHAIVETDGLETPGSKSRPSAWILSARGWSTGCVPGSPKG